MDELFAHFRSYWPRDGSSSSSLGAAGPAAPAAPAEGDGSDEEEEDQESESLDEQDPVPAVESDGYDVELAAALGVPKVVVENLSPKKPSLRSLRSKTHLWQHSQSQSKGSVGFKNCSHPVKMLRRFYYYPTLPVLMALLILCPPWSFHLHLSHSQVLAGESPQQEGRGGEDRVFADFRWRPCRFGLAL